MADIIPHDFFRSIMEKEQDLNATDVIKVALVKATYTPSVDHTQYSDFSGHELAGTNGYTVGGVVVAATVTDDDTNNLAKFDTADPSWTASGGQLGGADARYGIWHNSSTNGIIYIRDFGSAITVADGQQFSIQVDSAGLFTIA